ncbi:MAG: hypothetical protein ACKO23_02940, partial [Gemmataceae bacterium]
VYMMDNSYSGIDHHFIPRMAWLNLLLLAGSFLLASLAGRTSLGLPALYFTGLQMVGLILIQIHPTPPQRFAAYALALAGHHLVAATVVRSWQIWSRRSTIDSSPLLRMEPLLPDGVSRWFTPLQVILAGIVVYFGLTSTIQPLTLSARFIGGLAILLLAPSYWLFSRFVEESHREKFVSLAMLFGQLAIIAGIWAIPNPSSPESWLMRGCGTFLALCATGTLGLQFGSDFVRRFALWVAGAALAMGGILVVQSLSHLQPELHHSALPPWAIWSSAGAMILLIFQAFRLALTGDPLGTPAPKRGLYVYLAELALLLLFVHLRINVPELFSGFLARYWSFVVLALAFLGVGLGEWMERLGLQVLSQPLRRTGVLLPLLPLIAFWARPPMALMHFAQTQAPAMAPILQSALDRPMALDTHALIWLLTSGLYSILAITHGSRRWGLAAAIAANLGYWAFLLHLEIPFFLHPQAWIIPVGVILLIVEHLQREDLSPSQAEGLRYLGITMIYAASTADLFLVGLGNSFWLPTFLAILCIAGILLGISLRVRAFLFLGFSFLLVDILAMVWNAAVNRAHTWVWWASGIVLGLAILILFGIFEKRRKDLQRMMDDLRHWN